jgi:hypothetical protein
VAGSTTSVFHLPPAGDQSTDTSARTLDRIVENSTEINGVWSDDVKAGDWIVVRTRNSTYSLASQGDGVFRVAGGWFATAHAEDRPVRIAGCTWGGAVIHTRLLAAVGMFLEFDNGVRTTRIREARLIRGADGKEH